MPAIIIRDLERNEVLDTSAIKKVCGGLWTSKIRKPRPGKLQSIRQRSSLISGSPLEIP